MSKPIAEISLPSHHPAVAGCKPGQMVSMRAVRVAEPEPPKGFNDGGEVKGQRPPPLTCRFHVVHMEKGKGMPARKKVGPMEYLKSKQTEADID